MLRYDSLYLRVRQSRCKRGRCVPQAKFVASGFLQNIVGAFPETNEGYEYRHGSATARGDMLVGEAWGRGDLHVWAWHGGGVMFVSHGGTSSLWGNIWSCLNLST